jgi:anaerobic selenocysteine-containing dehydrogenase
MVSSASGTAREIRYSVCPYNCWPINCGIELTVEDGQVTGLRGNPHHDLNRGMLCVKGQSCREIHDNPRRLTHPLRRDGARGENRWQRISWEAALDEIAGRMRRNSEAGRHQANAIYHSHGNIVQRVNWKILTPRFANLAGMTLWDGNFPCWYDVGLGQALTGYYGLHDPVEMGAHAAAVVNWAQDPCASMANMVPYLIQVQERGGTVVTIDPRVTQTAALSTVHIRPRLGSDVWLANAVAHILIRENAIDEAFLTHHTYGYERFREHVLRFDPATAAAECELEVREIEHLAELYAETRPLCTNLSRGALGKHWNGVQMVRAILCLVALSGNVAVKGGGVVWGETIDWNLGLQARDRRPADVRFPENNFNAIDTALAAGEIDVLLVVGGNPMSQWPDINRLRQQLRQVGLVVVCDLFLNHTAREVGDIVLPATSWLEELGLRTSGSRIYLMDKVAEPLAECREASWWMDGICKRLGIDDYFPWADKKACLDACLDTEQCRNATVDKLLRRPGGVAGVVPEIPYADGRFSSPSGKLELYSQKAESLGIEPLPVHTEPIEGVRSTPELAARYPLVLVSARRNTHFHSFHDSHRVIPTLQALEPGPRLWVHPRDAAARGLDDGDVAEMFNDRGAGRVSIELTTEVLPGHVSLNDCWPELNAVTAPRCPVDPAVTAALGVGGQPSYQNTLVEIRKVVP